MKNKEVRIETKHEPKKGGRQTNIIITEPSELLPFLYEKFKDRSRNTVKSLLVHKKVLVNGRIISQHNHPLVEGDNITIVWESQIVQTYEYPGVKILFEDEDIIVIEKEAGLLSMATDNKLDETAYSILSNHVKQQHRDNKIFIVHRLDRETSGLMIFAKNQEAKEIMQKDWQDTVEERTYVAVVEGRVSPLEDTIESWLRESKAFIMHSTQDPSSGVHAVTHYSVIKQNDYYSLLAVELETGRKNQIRVHMQDIRHSVVGDKKYGSKQNPIGRLALHAQVLAFRHPVTDEEMRYESPIPRKFLRLVE